MLTVDFGDHLEARLRSLSAQSGREPRDFLREALVEYLEDLEDIAEAEERLRHPERIYTAEEAKRELDL